MENNEPKVYYSPQAVNPVKKKWFNARLIFLPLIAIVVIEIGLGIKTLLTPLPVKKAAVLQPVSGAKLMLITPKKSYKVGETVPVSIRLVTGGHAVAGTELALNYDPKLLDASSSAFVKGKIYKDYPYVNVNSKSGVIRASGITSVSQKGFNGVGIFGTVNLKAKATGKAKITVNYKKEGKIASGSSAIDFSSNQNILDQVSSLELDIK